MAETSAPHVSQLAVAEIERRLQWRARPSLMFLGILALLLAAGFWPSLFPSRHIAGLPDDPDVAAAAQVVRGFVGLPSSDMRFQSALTGEIVPGSRGSVDAVEHVERAERLLAAARPRLKRDPRLEVTRAALDLVRHRYASAERRYRAALDHSPNYPEARLGLGVTRALAGEIERNVLAQRQRFLSAIAQFAAVTPGDVEYEDALFNRALLLDRVGRHDEATRLARVAR